MLRAQHNDEIFETELEEEEEEVNGVYVGDMYDDYTEFELCNM